MVRVAKAKEEGLIIGEVRKNSLKEVLLKTSSED
jgi:hypothetical protein